MAEVEIKLEIPESTKDQVFAAARRRQGRTRSQRAIYFDMPSNVLSTHGFVLRLRLEDGRWIQTVKAPGSSAVERLEHEADAGAASGSMPPALDLCLHDGTPVGKALRRPLAWKGASAPSELAPRFEVTVERWISELRHGGSSIELALDLGQVEAQGRTGPICELELELKEGRVADLVALARQWRSEHHLSLSVISKAQKGAQLAAGQRFGPAVTARESVQQRGATAGAMTRAVLQSCADQVIANASEISAGSQDANHVHQLRVGIRRLRTALRELPLAAVPSGDMEAALVRAFRQLGEHRDRQHVVQSLAPKVEAAGGARIDFASPEPESLPADIVDKDDFQDALLQLIALAHGVDESDGGRARKQLAPALDKLLRKVLRDGRHFAELPADQQHGVRKRLKRLRYLSEFAAPQFRRGPVKRFIEQLKPVQEALGAYNDGLVALEIYRAAARDNPQAAFGAGWLTAQADLQVHQCAKALRRLNKAEPFWR